MKAGNAGSNPDDATSSENNRSFGLTIFLNEIGEAVSNLNTIVVGLDAVEKGHKKPDSLDISWSPLDLKAAARKARRFTLESVLVRVAESLNQYVVALSKLPRFEEIKSSWNDPNQNASAAIKLNDVASFVLDEDEYLLSAATLLIHWRNHVVHEKSKADLNHNQKQLLRRNEHEIAEKYKALSVDCLLCHYREGRPTLKDISSLTSMTINLVRKIDSRICESFNKDDLEAWLDYYGISPLIEKVTLETAPEKLEASIRRVFMTHAPKLLDPYQKFF